jgi:hypothetical protein
MLKIKNLNELRSVKDFDSGVFANWQTPPMILTITVLDNSQVLASLDDTKTLNTEPTKVHSWNFTQAVKQTHLGVLLSLLKGFREAMPDYWSQIGQDIDSELQCYIPDEDWQVAENTAGFCGNHLNGRNTISGNKALWDLARASYEFFDAVFPKTTSLRGLIDQLPMGSRINVTWVPQRGDCIFNIPWGLLYSVNPQRGESILGSNFWSLRYRIHYHTHDSYGGASQSRALGDPAHTYFGHVLYWQGDDDDLVLREANWQRQRLSTSRMNFIMPVESELNSKDDVLAWLESLTPTPMPLLYFYCKANVDAHCVLEFGKRGIDRHSYRIQEIELPNQRLNEVRFVFCNACGSGMPQPGQAFNRLENRFFSWGCMAYLGTIHETPIEFASRFSMIFFHFFCNRIGKRIVSSGEAFSQAKRYLWLKHGNLGGLFYTYINEYDLYFADTKEVQRCQSFMGI